MRKDVGEHLGNYRILRLLGEGGQASVYLGEHVYLKSQAALKVRHTTITEEEQVVFLQEAQTLVQLSHPHIVRVLDFALQDGMPYLVMEYAAHGTLRQHHPKGTRLPLEIILPYVKQVASALQYTHDQGLIHRDVKPENMLLNTRDQVLLSDFGLVMIVPHLLPSEATEPMEQSLAGTTSYLAPEEVRGKAQPASDQYALGVVVYEWLCGQPPFQGPFLEVAVKLVSEPIPSLREQVPDLSLAVEEVVLRALAKEPKQRFASAQDFAFALECACSASGVVSAPSRGEAAIVADSVSLAVVQRQLSAQPFSEDEPGVETALTGESIDLAPTKEAEPVHTRPWWKVPAFLTPFIGRQQEVAAICAILSRPEVHLLTLWGTGGIGKTRLAIEAAGMMRTSFADGVCFVGLAPISDPNLVMPTIARALSIQKTAERSLIEQMQAILREKRLLLVLDNLEQVVSSATAVEELLLACPYVKALVTSREVLRLQVERLFPVPPFTLPNLNELPAYEMLMRNAAVALFQQRARAVMPTFYVTSENGRTIAEICVRLDGLPLAIELAAARIRLLPPKALLSRLLSRLQVLTSGARTLPTRQQTLRNTLQWSYDLLDAQEQQLFRRLSIFVGGCELSAVEALYREVGDQTIDVLNVMASLLDKSLILQAEQAGDEPRFMLLETMREFGLEALAASGEMGTIRQAHAAYYLGLAEEAEPEWEGPKQAVWSERLEQERDNVRAAMLWSLERGEIDHDWELALRLGGALRRFWQVRGYLSEGRAFLEKVLAGSVGVVSAGHVKALIAMGHIAVVQCDCDRVESACKESLVLCQELGNIVGSARSLYLLGWASWMRGDLVVARSQLEQTITLFRQVGDETGIAWSLMHLGCTAGRKGDYAESRFFFEENLARQRRLGNKRGIAFSLCTFVLMLIDAQYDLATVHSMLEEGLALFREIGDKWGVATACMLLGRVALQQGDVTTARSLAEKSVRLCREVGNRLDTSHSLATLAAVAIVQHDWATARALYQESLDFSREMGDKVFIASGLEGLAAVVAMQGEPMWATQLWGAASALRDTIGAPIPPIERADYEEATAAVRIHLGEKAYAAAWSQGRMMTPEQVLQARNQETTHQQSSAGAVATSLAKVPSYPAELTAREVEVLRLVAKGLTDRQIAEQLVISPRTVNTHLTSIYNKLGVDSRAAATRFAVEHRLV
jgi:predicted ATPase/DNA-binding CsgD family transcriptional regulator/tRNA A-37 threonylcarbamoyl transferase component Bud32